MIETTWPGCCCWFHALGLNYAYLNSSAYIFDSLISPISLDIFDQVRSQGGDRGRREGIYTTSWLILSNQITIASTALGLQASPLSLPPTSIFILCNLFFLSYHSPFSSDFSPFCLSVNLFSSYSSSSLHTSIDSNEDTLGASSYWVA